MKSAIKLAGLYGLGEVRTKHIARDCGLAEANIYRHFTGKEDLLQSCYGAVDGRIAAFCRKMSRGPGGNDDETFRDRWGRLFHYLLRHPDDTIFYYYYRTSGLAGSRAAARFKASAAVSPLFPREWEECPREQQYILTEYLFYNSVHFAYQILTNHLEVNPDMVDQVCCLIYGGVELAASASAQDYYKEGTA